MDAIVCCFLLGPVFKEVVRHAPVLGRNLWTGTAADLLAAASDSEEETSPHGAGRLQEKGHQEPMVGHADLRHVWAHLERQQQR